MFYSTSILICSGLLSTASVKPESEITPASEPRLTAEDEMAGMDHSLHGEHGYGLINPN